MKRTLSSLVIIITLSAVSQAQVLVGAEDFESYSTGTWDAVSAPAADPALPDGGVSATIVDVGGANQELWVDLNLSNWWSGAVDFNLDLSGNESGNLADYTMEIHIRFDPATVTNLEGLAFELGISNTNDPDQSFWYPFNDLDSAGYENAKTNSNGYTFTIPMGTGWIHWSKSEALNPSIPSWRISILAGSGTQQTDDYPINFMIDDLTVNYTEPGFLNPTGTPTGPQTTNSVTVTGTVIDGTSEVVTMTLLLDDVVVASNSAYAGGSTTNSISYDAISLEEGLHTAAVLALDATGTNTIWHDWSFQVLGAPPVPSTVAIALYNINFEGSSLDDGEGNTGGGLYPVTNGLIAVAPSLGSNNWANIDYPNPWYWGWQSHAVSEAGGEGMFSDITYELLESSGKIELYVPYSWGTDQNDFSLAATNTIWATAVGGTDADLDFELRDLDGSFTYDLYLYFTCPANPNPATTTYTITTGVAPSLEATLTSTQLPLASGYDNYVWAENYVVITEIAPEEGIIAFNASGDSIGGGLSALQLVARRPEPSVDPDIQSIGVSGGMVNLSWESEDYIDYTILSKSSLMDGSWNVVSNGIPSAGTNTSVSVPASSTGMTEFYSIEGY